MRNRFLQASVLAVVVLVLASRANADADAVVSDGRFTNVYVYPHPSLETWEQHLQNLPANQKPSDWQSFTRPSIDAFTETLMSPEWPSYFGALHQYGGINPPRFFGSYVASQECVDAAMRDLHNGVLEQTTIRSLSNCHKDGMDPSPQVNLIFSPDIKIGEPALLTANGPDICSETGQHAIAYHGWGLNTPNYAVLPTAAGCAPRFSQFTESVSHEVVEMLSDPGQVGHGSWGGGELGDQCQSIDVTWNGFNIQRYRSDNDNVCWPLNFPTGSITTTWVLAEASPTIRFTGDVHTLTLNVPDRRVVTSARATEVQIWIQTGGDDLRGGNNANDNADVTLAFSGGSTVTKNINSSREWGNGQTHIARLTLPAAGLSVQDIRSITITTHFGGGIGGDNWNVDKVALMVGFPAGSRTLVPPPIIVREWLDKSGGPLIRFTGDVHNFVEAVANQDNGIAISNLDLIISTGNDDLRGGNNAGDNCDVTIELGNGKSITVNNVNNGSDWNNWTDHTVRIPLPNGGLRGGDVKSVKLHTGFGGGIGGDNWNVQRIQLRATLSTAEGQYAAPLLQTDVAARGPSLFHPALGVSQLQVRAGRQLGVTGSHFPMAPSSEIKIDWNDTVLETDVVASDITWGPANGSMRTVRKPRQARDNGNSFTAANLTPNTLYEFSVRNCDALACSAWSNVLNARTQGSDQAQLLLDTNSTSTVVGNATLGGEGGFATTVTVPASVPAGTHRLRADVAGTEAAATTITVLGARENAQATLVFVDPNVPGGTLSTMRVEETHPLTLRGEGFKPAPVSFHIDSPSGKELGAAMPNVNGMFTVTFTWPQGIYGAHTIIASEVSGGQATSANAGVWAEQLPH